MNHHCVIRDGDQWACVHCPGRWPYPEPVPAGACITRTWNDDPGDPPAVDSSPKGTTVKTIEQMTIEIRENVVAHGFRPATGGPGMNTWGDYVGLLHSEISEMLEAFRTWRLADATETGCTHDGPTCANHPGKPEGVGSEAADTLIRLIDMADVFGFRLADPGSELADLFPTYPTSGLPSTFGGSIAWLHAEVSKLYPYTIEIPTVSIRNQARMVLRALIALAQRYDIDMMFEYERKMAYNRTRPYQHGGRTLADSTDSQPAS